MLAGVPVLSQMLLEVIRLTMYGHLVPNSLLFKAGRGDPLGVSIQEIGALPTDEQVEEIHRRRPDVIVVASFLADAFIGIYEVDRALLEHPAAAPYRQVFVAPGGAPTCDHALIAYRRRGERCGRHTAPDTPRAGTPAR